MFWYVMLMLFSPLYLMFGLVFRGQQIRLVLALHHQVLILQPQLGKLPSLVPSVRANHRRNRSQWADIGTYVLTMAVSRALVRCYRSHRPLTDTSGLVPGRKVRAGWGSQAGCGAFREDTLQSRVELGQHERGQEAEDRDEAGEFVGFVEGLGDHCVGEHSENRARGKGDGGRSDIEREVPEKQIAHQGGQACEKRDTSPDPEDVRRRASGPFHPR